MIRELAIQVMNQYRQESKKAFTKNPLGQILRKDLPKALKELSNITEKYKIKGSAGAGKWAEIPWVAIMDIEITKTPEFGYYIVFLFDSEMQGFYLSLNQSWTQYEKKFNQNQRACQIECREITSFLQEKLNSALPDFSYERIDLHPKHNLGKGYEAGHICGKYYPLSEIPDDQYLINDLRNLIGVYRELKGIVGKEILEVKNIYEIDDSIKKEIATEELQIEISELKLATADPAPAKKYAHGLITRFDEEADAINQKEYKRIGKRAEKIVAEAEQRYLTKLGKGGLASKVKIVSENPALGYDVRSYEPNGTEKQIEVKGTRSHRFTFFVLTPYEQVASKTLPNYYLYHVHSIDFEKPSIGYIKQPNFESNLFCLEPLRMKVTYKLQPAVIK